MRRKVLTALLFAATLAGCSSIVSKSEYAVAIDSVPSTASFTIANKAGINVHSGTTPATVTLKASAGYFKGESYLLTVNKDGYTTRTYQITSSLDGWYFGNILIGGLIGMLVVDPLTGAMYSLPKTAAVTLDVAKAETPSSGEIRIVSIESLSNAEIARLEPIH